MTNPTTDRVALLRLQAQMADLSRKVGARIKELREERKLTDPRWTQDYLARQVEEHLNGTQMSRYERGETMPSEKRLERIAKLLGTDVSDLYAGPLAEREEAEPGGDLMGSLSEATGESALTEAVDGLTKRVAALETALTAEMGKVRKALEAQQKTLARGGRSRAKGPK